MTDSLAKLKEKVASEQRCSTARGDCIETAEDRLRLLDCIAASWGADADAAVDELAESATRELDAGLAEAPYAEATAAAAAELADAEREARADRARLINSSMPPLPPWRKP
jgi:hypothetical protein